ncbi:MAG: AarF/UbiB family protein [Ilumatobacteraceae bacterium]
MSVFASALGVSVGIVAGIILAIVITSISLRLLGMRRGWGTALLAGVLGWGVAIAVALGLSEWDWGADGLALHVVAIGVPATMTAAVTLDLLARPGSLAIGERAGLVVTPRPVRAVRRRIAVFRRYRELLGLARREGFGPLRPATAVSTDSQAVRLRRVLEEAGGVYVKLGQIAATRVDLLPADVCAELATLQNRVPPEPREHIAAVLQAELGDIETIFAEFEWEPLAAASIGQTHRAVLRSGEAVVVKVQRPGIEATMDRDLAALALLADLAQRRTSFGRGVRSGDVLAQFAEGLRAELDFRREADAMTEMASRLDGEAAVRVPTLHRHLCTRRVLVQGRFEGRTVSDTARLDDAGVDRGALADQLLRSMLDQVVRLGFFHADPHPGNVFVLDDGTIGLIDFGAVGRLDPIQQSAMVDIFVALARRDVGLLRDGVERVANVNEATSADELERALARMMAEHVRPGGNIDPDAMQQLVVVLADFGMRLPTDVVLLSRALITLDGTLRVLSPGRSLMTSALQLLDSPSAPVVDREQLVRDELLAALPHLRRLPERVDRILGLTARGELRIRHVTDEDSRRILRTLVNRVLLGGIGAAVLAVSAVLLVAPDPGPAVSEGTGLFEVFGYGGLLAGAVLVLRVVAAVARDGTT